MLNQELYEKLREIFGTVIVANQGIQMKFRVTLDAVTQKYKVEINRELGDSSGEEYRVNCFNCGDTRHRLYINHRFGTKIDDQRVSKEDRIMRFWWMCNCFNESCDVRRELEDRLGGYVKRARFGEVSVLEGKEATVQEVGLPGMCTTLDQLDPTHEAVRYVVGRGFDPVKLGKKSWAYCHEFANRNVQGRLIIPVIRHGEIVGWQARLLGTPPNRRVPKYYTCPGFPKNRVLYNFDTAKGYDDVSVVEGPFDCESSGDDSVGVLGKKISEIQLQLLFIHWKDAIIYVMLDPEASLEMVDLCSMLRRSDKFQYVVPVKVPDGRDPGSMERAEIEALKRTSLQEVLGV